MLRELYSKIWNKTFAEMVWDYNSYHGHQVSISMKKERETIHLSEGMIYKYLNLAKESDWLLRVALRVDSRTLESNKCWHFVWKQRQSIIKCTFVTCWKIELTSALTIYQLERGTRTQAWSLISGYYKVAGINSLPRVGLRLAPCLWVCVLPSAQDSLPQ